MPQASGTSSLHCEESHSSLTLFVLGGTAAPRAAHILVLEPVDVPPYMAKGAPQMGRRREDGPGSSQVISGSSQEGGRGSQVETKARAV